MDYLCGMCVYNVYVCVHISACVWQSEDNFGGVNSLFTSLSVFQRWIVWSEPFPTKLPQQLGPQFFLSDELCTDILYVCYLLSQYCVLGTMLAFSYIISLIVSNHQC